MPLTACTALPLLTWEPAKTAYAVGTMLRCRASTFVGSLPTSRSLSSMTAALVCGLAQVSP